MLGIIKKYEVIKIDEFAKLGQYNSKSIEHHPQKFSKYFYEIETIENRKKYKLIPGILNEDKIHQQVPFYCYYLKINYILKEKETWREEFLNWTLNITIFTKNFSNSRTVNINFSKEFPSNIISLNHENFDDVINLLNTYIDANLDIQKIIPDKIKQEVFNQNIFYDHWRTINSIFFEFYNNSNNYVGKDNSFWQEVEVRNLPDDYYIKNLIIKSLQGFFESSSHRLTEYGYCFNLGYHKGYSASYPKSEVSKRESLSLSNKITDKLKMDFVKYYNKEKHLFKIITK